jgi:hypothetical protein
MQTANRRMQVRRVTKINKKKQTPPPLVGEVSANFCGYKGVAQSAWLIPYGSNLGFPDQEKRYHQASVSVRALSDDISI